MTAREIAVECAKAAAIAFAQALGAAAGNSVKTVIEKVKESGIGQDTVVE